MSKPIKHKNLGRTLPLSGKNPGKTLLLRNKRILLTGGAGFIGSALCRRLVRENTILVFDNYRRNALQYFKQSGVADIEVVQGDILDPVLFKGVVSIFKPQIVIHLAAMAGVTDYYQQPVKTLEVNAVGTYNVLQAIKDSALEKFLYFSTSEVYGPLVFGAKEDGNTAQGNIKQVRWNYGISKLAGEAMAFAFGGQYNIPMTSVRPFNIYGPGQVGEGAIQIFIRKALKNETINVTGDGNQLRAWCFIEDFIDGVICVLENKKTDGEIFNLGNPEGTVTILRLAKDIISYADSKSKIKLIPHKGVDIDLRVPNIRKAEEMFGFTPKVMLEEGLKKSIKWYRETKVNEG